MEFCFTQLTTDHSFWIMGKTKLFGVRPASKTNRGVIREGEESEFVERFKSPSPESKLSKVGGNSRSESRGYDEKYARRKQAETRAKQLADNKNSLKRRKKQETARSMAQKIPRDVLKDSHDNGNNDVRQGRMRLHCL